jgi:polyhydroxybutyrate depolymerase
MQLPDPDIHHRRTLRRRRFAGFIGIFISIALLLSVAIYAYDLHLSPLTQIKTIINGSPTSTPTPIVTCKTAHHDPGDSTASIISGGIQRTMLIHLAPSYGIQPQALVVNYHGYNFTAQHMARYSNMATEANQAGFILVFPEGVDSPPSWNAGLGAQGPTGSADDVQFTRDMLKYLEKNYCIDVHRVYVTGFSLGGGMAYRIACTLSDQIAAVATVAGAFYHAPGGCLPSRPVPVLEIHGQADQDAPYNGNPAMGMAAVQVYLNVWLGHDQCSGTSQVIFKQADVTGIEWKQCADHTVVIHYRISDGGHTWPGGGSITSLGYTTHTIDANVVIWKFFSQYETP